jgi:hypothetical protein
MRRLTPGRPHSQEGLRKHSNTGRPLVASVAMTDPGVKHAVSGTDQNSASKQVHDGKSSPGIYYSYHAATSVTGNRIFEAKQHAVWVLGLCAVRIQLGPCMHLLMFIL